MALIGQLSEANTADAVLAKHRVGATTQAAPRVSASGELGRSCLLDFHTGFGHVLNLPSLSSLRERHAEQPEQFLALLVGLSRRNEEIISN